MEAPSSPMNVLDILKVLPHRAPFLLVDKIVELLPAPNYPNRVGRKVRGIKNVTYNEPFFEGHFPHRPVMPGVLIIETMAQVSAMGAYQPELKQQDVAIVGIDKARFRKPVVPGDTLEVHSEVIKDRSRIICFKCKGFVDGQVVAEAEIMAQMFDMEK